MATSSTNSLGSVGLGPNSADPIGSSKLGKDEFLKLLMAQLAHQDPTAPADSNAFVAQLAQFASMEQLQSVNSQLEALLVAQTANNQTSVSSLVGRDVVYRTDRVHLDESGQVSLQGNLAAA